MKGQKSHKISRQCQGCREELLQFLLLVACCRPFCPISGLHSDLSGPLLPLPASQLEILQNPVPGTRLKQLPTAHATIQCISHIQNPSSSLLLDFLVYNNNGFGFNRLVLVGDPQDRERPTWEPQCSGRGLFHPTPPLSHQPSLQSHPLLCPVSPSDITLSHAAQEPLPL